MSKPNPKTVAVEDPFAFEWNSLPEISGAEAIHRLSGPQKVEIISIRESISRHRSAKSVQILGGQAQLPAIEITVVVKNETGEVTHQSVINYGPDSIQNLGELFFQGQMGIAKIPDRSMKFEFEKLRPISRMNFNGETLACLVPENALRAKTTETGYEWKHFLYFRFRELALAIDSDPMKILEDFHSFLKDVKVDMGAWTGFPNGIQTVPHDFTGQDNNRVRGVSFGVRTYEATTSDNDVQAFLQRFGKVPSTATA